MAFRLHKYDYAKFSKEAEELSEDFRRSLVVEVIPKTTATKMTIDKTIELCRKTTINETVRSVVAASSYETPSDVIATFVTQSDIARQERRDANNAKNKNNSKNGNFKDKKNGYKNFRSKQNGHRQSNDQQRSNDQNKRQNFNKNKGRPEHVIRLVSGNESNPSGGGASSSRNYQEEGINISFH